MYSSVDAAGMQSFNDWFVPDSTQRHGLGLAVSGWDPYWGYADFVYAKFGGTVAAKNLCRMDNTFSMTATPNTANLGQQCYIAVQSGVTGNFGWFQRSGLAPIATTATVAANVAIGLTGAGTVGANTAGKQILSCTNVLGATATVVKNINILNGSGIGICAVDYSGFFVGIALSGTGIPASTVVAALGSDGRTVYFGSVIGTFDKTATATSLASVTGTYTGYGVALIDYPFVQGAIT